MTAVITGELKQPRLARCLFQSPDPSRRAVSSDPIIAIQDFYGNCYRRLLVPALPGEILEAKIRHREEERSISNDGKSRSNFKVIRKISPGELKALVLRLELDDFSLKPGHWYEVHQD